MCADRAARGSCTINVVPVLLGTGFAGSVLRALDPKVEHSEIPWAHAPACSALVTGMASAVDRLLDELLSSDDDEVGTVRLLVMP
jgi:hypothetical protein